MNLKRCQASCRQLFGKVDKFLIINLEVWTRDNNLFFFSEYALCVTFYQKRLIKHNFTLSTICLHQYMQVFFYYRCKQPWKGISKITISKKTRNPYSNRLCLSIFQNRVHIPKWCLQTKHASTNTELTAILMLNCMMGKMSVVQKTGTFKLKIPTWASCDFFN